MHRIMRITAPGKRTVIRHQHDGHIFWIDRPFAEALNTLHNMFMGQYTEQWNALDIIAERIRALGVLAPGSYEEYEKLTTIPAVKGKPKALEMVALLVSAQEATARTARDLLPLVTEANDQPTTDLITQRLDVHEKTAWMLRSLLEE